MKSSSKVFQRKPRVGFSYHHVSESIRYSPRITQGYRTNQKVSISHIKSSPDFKVSSYFHKISSQICVLLELVLMMCGPRTGTYCLWDFSCFFGLRYIFLICSYHIGNSAALSVCSGQAQDLTFLCLGVLSTFLNWVKEEDMPHLPQRQCGVLRKDMVWGRCPQRGAKRLYGGSSLRQVSKLGCERFCVSFASSTPKGRT